jgi:uncharacterized membrane protein SirB2
MWLYKLHPLLIFSGCFAVLIILAWLGYLLGNRWRSASSVGNSHYLSQVIPSTVLALLSLILAFTFSLAISRFENRRQLAIDEANAIGTTYLRATTLRPPYDRHITALIKSYLEWRIVTYRDFESWEKRQEAYFQTKRLQDEIWSEIERSVEDERTVLESIFITSLNQMFDLENERSIALTKTLPGMIYLTILLISGAGLATLNFVRGQKGEAGQWQVAILAGLIAFTVYCIVDLDTPTSGQIQITQDAFTLLQKSLSE